MDRGRRAHDGGRRLTIVLATGCFAPGTSLGEAATAARSLGLGRLALDFPGPVAGGRREELKPLGVGIEAVVQQGGAGASLEDPRAFAAGLERQAAWTARLKAAWTVVEAGDLGGRDERELSRRDGALVTARSDEDSDAVAALREPHRAGAVERAARALHDGLRVGVPLAVRNAGGAAGLLGFEETGWLLDALPRLRLAFDPTRALRLHRLGLGPNPASWAEQYASRSTLLFVHGLGADFAGGSHPEDGAPAWPILRDILPDRLPRVLEVRPTLTHAEVLDAVGYVRHETYVTSPA